MLIISLFALFFSIKDTKVYQSVIFSAIVTLNVVVFILARFIKTLPQKFQVPEMFMQPLRKFLKLKLIVYENLIMNRSNSLLKMTNDVFLKHVRRLNYNRIYQDASWKNRRIMNAIYELRHEERKLKKRIEDKKIKDYLIPSKEIQNVASRAARMGTTLWFTKEELNKKF